MTGERKINSDLEKNPSGKALAGARPGEVVGQLFGAQLRAHTWLQSLLGGSQAERLRSRGEPLWFPSHSPENSLCEAL